MKTIDHISIKDIFWFQVKENLISFGFKGLPNGTHFTIVFDDKKPDINFHVTKNTSSSTDKPQIKIILINKELLAEVAPSFTIALLNKILRPIDIDELKKRYDYELGYIPFDKIEQPDSYILIERKLIDSFKDISRIRKKTRLKVGGDIGKRIEYLATSEEMRTFILNNMVELSTEFKNPIDGGIIISEENTIQVIRINNDWYTFRTKLKPFDLLTAFVNPELANYLIWKTKRALISVKNAKSYADTKHLNKPIRLVKQTENK